MKVSMLEKTKGASTELESDQVVAVPSVTPQRITPQALSPVTLTPQTLRHASVFAVATTLWAVFSLPTILLAEWFPLDVGGIFQLGNNFKHWLPWIISPYNGSGRYFPIYWLYHTFEFFLFGTNLSPYYVVQSVVFLATALSTSAILLKISGSYRLAAVLLAIFYFSSGAPEILCTIGKPEPILYLFVIAIILAFCVTHLKNRGAIDMKGVLVSAAIISLLFPLAIWTKETSIILLGFGVSGLVLSILLGKLRRWPEYTGAAKQYGYFLLALLVGLCISRLPYVIFPVTKKATIYTSYDVTFDLIRDNFVFYVSQQPDIILFGLLALALLALAGKRLFLHSEPPNQFEARGYIFVVSLCAMAWAYYLGLLIWRWPMAYYMLLPGALFRLCALYGIYVTGAYKLVGRPVRYATYGFVGLSTLYVVFYAYYIFASQIAYSRLYTDALQTYISLPAKKTSLVMESYQFFAEQVGATGLILSTETGVDYSIKGIADVLDPETTSNKELLKLLEVTQAQIDANVNNLPKSGDYLLVMTGSKLATWFLRGVTPYYSTESLLKLQAPSDMELVAERRIENPALYVHVWTYLPTADETWLGYKLYRVLEDRPKFLWHGRYPDGWAGKSSSLKVNPSYGRPVVIRFSAPDFALPQKVTIRKDGQLFKEIIVTDTDEKVLTLSDPVDGTTVFQFDVQKTVVPKKIKLNKDTRELGLRITLDAT